MSHIEKVMVIKGRVRWYYNHVAGNGKILSTSQKYFSKSNAVRAARRLCISTGAYLYIDGVAI